MKSNNSDGQNPTGQTTDNTAVTPATDLVAAKLAEFGITDENIITNIKAQGVKTPKQLALLKEEDFIAAGLDKVQTRELLASVTQTGSSDSAENIETLLPAVPDDGPWLDALKTGGVLKVEESTVISAIRAALANRVGLFDLPAKVVEAMEKFADGNDEPVDPIFYQIRKQLTRRSYAEVFEAIDGFDGTYVTEVRKKQLFSRIDQYLWPAIFGFYSQLNSWYEIWTKNAMNPMNFMRMAVGQHGAGIPSMNQAPPDTGVLHDYSSAVNDAINKVFAGPGVQIATALAYDASQIKKMLTNNRLPSLVGAANRDQMLKQLKVAVNPTYPRLEASITKFVLATLQVKDQAAGNEEWQYLEALYNLGSQIPWDTLGGGQFIAGIGGGRINQQL